MPDVFNRAYASGNIQQSGGPYQFPNQFVVGQHRDTFLPPQPYSQQQPQGAPLMQQFGTIPNYNVMNQRNQPSNYGAQMTDSYQYPIRNV